jgi:hypothetical protein
LQGTHNQAYLAYYFVRKKRRVEFFIVTPVLALIIRDEHSSLFRRSVTDEEKKVLKIPISGGHLLCLEMYSSQETTTRENRSKACPPGTVFNQ